MKTFTSGSKQMAKQTQCNSLLGSFVKVFGTNCFKQVLALMVLVLMSSGAFGQSTWYTIASGKWTDPQIWTLDPAGAVPINPSSLYPNLTTDNIVVRTGITVTIPDGLTPYNSPLETKNNLNCGTLTVNGDLDFGVSTGHTFTQIKGNGRLYFESNNFPTANWSNFITAGVGGGTIVLKGITDFAVTNLPTSIYNLEINNSDKTKIYTLDQNLTVGGNLTVESGVFKINGTSTTVRNLTVNGNVNVKANGQIITGTTASKVFHWMNVYGDFTNNGVVDFSNSAQYAEASNGAVKLKFLGATNNNIVCNGTTDLYRLFVDKGTDQTYSIAVNANSSVNFKLFGPVTGTTTDATDGSYGWQCLPIVLVNGTLKLESNILLDRMGSNMTGAAPNEFTIPLSTQLWVNGATLTSSNATGAWNGITIYGKLKISAGTVTTPANTNGIYYATDGTTVPQFEISGGTLNSTQIRPYIRHIDATNTDISAEKFVYSQSGGNVNFPYLATDNNKSAVFHLDNANHIFDMSGGNMNFSIANAANGWATGIRIESGVGNYSVTGGNIEITENATRDFMIFTTVPLYNITTFSVGGVTTKIQVVDTWGTPGDASWPGDLKVSNNLIIASGTQFVDNGGNLNIGGDLTINGTFTQTGKLTFDGNKDGIVTNGSGSSFAFGDLNLSKGVNPTAGSFYKLTLVGTSGYSIAKNINLTRGRLDLINFDVNTAGNIEIVDGDLTSSGTGSIILSGSAQQTLKGATGVEQNFGRLQLNNSASQIKLLSNINATSVTFLRNQVFNMDIYNLDLSTANYNGLPFSGGAWGTSCMFSTSGKASDGGLSIGFTVNNSAATLATFPVGVLTTYAPCVVKSFAGQTSSTSGSLTVVPVNKAHPSTTDASKVLAYYWKTKVSGFAGLLNNKIQLAFISPLEIKGWSATYLKQNNDWSIGSTKYNNGDYTFYIDYTPGNTSYTNLIESDYTAGLDNGSGQIPLKGVKTYTSSINGQNWNEAKWTDESGLTNVGPPTAADIAIIPAGQSVTIALNTAVASILQLDGKLTVNDGTSGHKINTIKGGGRLIYVNNFDYGPNNIISGDHTQFCSSPTAIFEYAGTGSYYIPDNTVIPYYPNLYFSGGGTKNTPYNYDVRVNGNLFIDNSNFSVLRNNCKLTIGGDIVINTGTLVLNGNIDQYNFYNTYVEGSIKFNSSGSLISANSGTEFNIYLKGDVVLANGSTINLSDNGRKGNINFTGNNGATVSTPSAPIGTSTVKLYRTYINKPVGKKVQFTTPFSLNGPTDDATKSLVLQSGECHLDTSAITISLSTGGNPFKIPTGTTLRVDNGSQVNVGGSASNTGIWLDGALIVDNGGKVNCNQGSGSYLDNYIEYTPSGTASIWLGTNAQLLVGSQLRRTTSSDAGILRFTQAKASSVVTLGSKSAPTSNRGVFEVLNGGSAFKQLESGCNVTIVRGQTTASVPALIFNPDTVSLTTGARFTLGDATTPVSQNMGIYSGVELKDLTIGSTNAPTVTVKTGALTIGGNLVNGGTFNAAGYDVTLKGNFTNNGTYTPAGNTTWFSGSADQLINGTNPVAFYNLIKLNSPTLIMSSTVNVANDLTIGVPSPSAMGGTINTGAFDLNVARNLSINGTILSSGTSKGVVCNGSALQQLSGNATLARLYINNANGLDMPTQTPSINFTEWLHLETGVFNIGKNLITFDNDATITPPAGGFSSSCMVQTNTSFTDAGIRKMIPQGTWSIASPYSFVYPIGSQSKYTPINLMVVSNTGSGTGTIRVKAANEKHISVVDNAATTTIDETKNVLQYNWTMDATGISGFTGVAWMNFIGSDALVTAPNDTTQYISARILLNSTSWNKFDAKDFDGGGKKVIFKFSGTDDSGIDGDYTAGITNCIPDVVPAYISVVNNGPWSVASTWAQYNPITLVTGAAGVGVPAGGPRGAVVYINTTVTMPDNFMAAYRTYINKNAILSTGSSIGHRLGDVFGQGTLQMQTSNLPAGVYDNFFSINGGTLEYTGTSDYSILSEVTSLNNLKLSGSGQRNLPNIGFTVLGSLTLAGGDCKNPHNTNFAVNGNIKYTGGTFDANIATVSLTGTSAQVISGTSTFKSPNAFYNLVVNNRAGVIDSIAVDVSHVLTLTNGVINTDVASLTLTDTSPTAFVGGSDSSFVDGPLYKQINNSSNFSFPVGDNGRYGLIDVATNNASQGLWKVQYFNHSPATDNLTAKNAVAYVSSNEYWSVIAPSTTCVADITARLDNASGVNPSDPNSLFVNYAAAIVSPATPEGWTKATATWTGDMSAGTAKTLGAKFADFSGVGRFTFGASVIAQFTWEGDDATKPTDWFTSANWFGNVVPSASSNAIIASLPINKPVISGATVAQTNNLTIESGATLAVNSYGKLTVNGEFNINGTLTVNKGGELTVNGLLKNNGTLYVKNEFNAMASILTKGGIDLTATGTTTVTNLTPGGAFRYYGFSVNGPNVTTFNIWDVANTQASIAAYYHTDSGYLRFGVADVNITNPLVAGTSGSHGVMNGFSVKQRYVGDLTITSSGTLNNGNISTSLVANKWALLCNPYPSAIDMSVVYAASSNFGATKIDPTYWAPYDVNGVAAFATYNLSSGLSVLEGSKIVGPQQVFWIKNASTTDAYNLDLLQSARLHSNPTSILKSMSTNVESDVLRLKLVGASFTDELVVAFRDNGSVDFTELDSEKRMNTGVTSNNIYSLIGTKKAVIDVQGLVSAKTIIPIGVNVGTSVAGSYVITASNIDDFDLATDVFLDVMVNGDTTSYNLREISQVPITMAAGATIENQYALRFAPNNNGTPTVIPEVDGGSASANMTIQQLGNDALVTIPGEIDEKARIELYGIDGKLMKVKTGVEKVTRIKLPDINAGYIIKVINGNHVYSGRVVSIGN